MTRGTPSRSLDLFSMYIVFYVFIIVSFTIYWICQLINVGDCWRDPECGVDYFKNEVGIVEFWYSVVLHCYANLVWFTHEVHTHWMPVPYSGNATVRVKTTAYDGQMRTVYSDRTTTIVSEVYLPPTEVSTVYQATTVYLPATQTVADIIDTTPEWDEFENAWAVCYKTPPTITLTHIS